MRGYRKLKEVNFLNEPIFEVKKIAEDNGYAKFEISPLEQGYGQTLGNSLRRVLLLSLPGVAITSVRISGVKHQFSTLKGMKEDVVDLVLNLKKVRFEYTGSEENLSEKASISVEGPGEVKAGDIQLPPNLKVINPDFVIANLNKGTKLSADVKVESGVGYSPAEDRANRSEVGLIPVDASFTSIERVNYSVEETRVGKLTNYDKLLMEVWTDGSIDPEEALTKAGEILVSYFKQVANPKEVQEVEEEKEEDSLGPVGRLSVEEIGLPTRVANALVKSDIHTVEDLVNTPKEKLMKVRNLGEKSTKIIKAALGEKGVEYPQGE